MVTGGGGEEEENMASSPALGLDLDLDVSSITTALERLQTDPNSSSATESDTTRSSTPNGGMSSLTSSDLSMVTDGYTTPTAADPYLNMLGDDHPVRTTPGELQSSQSNVSPINDESTLISTPRKNQQHERADAEAFDLVTRREAAVGSMFSFEQATRGEYVTSDSESESESEAEHDLQNGTNERDEHADEDGESDEDSDDIDDEDEYDDYRPENSEEYSTDDNEDYESYEEDDDDSETLRGSDPEDNLTPTFLAPTTITFLVSPSHTGITVPLSLLYTSATFHPIYSSSFAHFSHSLPNRNRNHPIPPILDFTHFRIDTFKQVVSWMESGPQYAEDICKTIVFEHLPALYPSPSAAELRAEILVWSLQFDAGSDLDSGLWGEQDRRIGEGRKEEIKLMTDYYLIAWKLHCVWLQDVLITVLMGLYERARRLPSLGEVGYVFGLAASSNTSNTHGSNHNSAHARTCKLQHYLALTTQHHMLSFASPSSRRSIMRGVSNTSLWVLLSQYPALNREVMVLSRGVMSLERSGEFTLPPMKKYKVCEFHGHGFVEAGSAGKCKWDGKDVKEIRFRKEQVEAQDECEVKSASGDGESVVPALENSALNAGGGEGDGGLPHAGIRDAESTNRDHDGQGTDQTDNAVQSEDDLSTLTSQVN